MLRRKNTIEIVPYSQNYEAFVSSIIPKDWPFDFRRFIYLNQNCYYFHAYVIKFYKVAVGYGNLLCFGSIAWIGNLVITKAFRGLGLGSILLQHLIELGKNKGIRTFNLVSTSVGITLYQKFGFETEFRYCFYSTPPRCEEQIINTGISRAKREDIIAIAKFDKMINGEYRKEFIESHMAGIYVFRNNEKKLRGFLMDSLEDGLILAKEPTSGIELLKTKTQSLGGRRVVIPECNQIAMDYLEHNGFSYYTSLNRMRLGEKYKWKPHCVYNRGAGYCG